eukprot:CAMPEP_0172381852 /NCGR_PEP_ID=MMETSP1060-20121228/71163_1 /TAXON_ID=37318 /ORGANISM="Pseudo-nitzschia pungens, Strain cf. cingulata" /LENGTH=201 /DNA_ID=CAMNT_0013109641 /DNA_START=269 /DNA_END=870 /DNA_ORIENTATION=+
MVTQSNSRCSTHRGADRRRSREEPEEKKEADRNESNDRLENDAGADEGKTKPKAKTKAKTKSKNEDSDADSEEDRDYVLGGVRYATYQELVEAKRKRNQTRLLDLGFGTKNSKSGRKSSKGASNQDPNGNKGNNRNARGGNRKRPAPKKDGGGVKALSFCDAAETETRGKTSAREGTRVHGTAGQEERYPNQTTPKKNGVS